MTRNIHLIYIFVSCFPLILIACSSGSSNSNNETAPFPAPDETIPFSVPFEINEILFMSSSRNIDECFDNLGNLTASAYVFDSQVGLDDIDGISPDPLKTVDIIEYDNGNYIYEIIFQDAGSYRTAITCQASLDNPETDDDMRFIQTGIFFRVGDITENFIDGPLPDGHFSTTLDCLGCHRVTNDYDVAVVNHDFVQNGSCSECHFPVL